MPFGRYICVTWRSLIPRGREGRFEVTNPPPRTCNCKWCCHLVSSNEEQFCLLSNCFGLVCIVVMCVFCVCSEMMVEDEDKPLCFPPSKTQSVTSAQTFSHCTVSTVLLGSKGFCCQKCHFSFVKKCKFRQKYCHKSQISSKINIFVTTASFRHFVSFLSKTNSFGA